MSAGITADGIEYLLNLMRNAETPVGSYYVALIRDLPPGFTISGEELDEPTNPEYARGEIINDSGSWEVSDNTLSNAVEVPFPVATDDWGQIRYWALTDQPLDLGGRVLLAGEFSEALFVEALDQPVLDEGSLTFSLEGFQWLTVMP